MKPRIDVVAAIIRREDGAFLCAQRSQTMSLAGMWEFPGGKIEINEHPYDALIREIHEELGCLIVRDDSIAYTDTSYEYDTVWVRLITWRCSIQEGIPLAKEHQALLWLQPADMSGLDWAAADLPAVHRILRECSVLQSDRNIKTNGVSMNNEEERKYVELESD